MANSISNEKHLVENVKTLADLKICKGFSLASESFIYN